MRKPVEVVLVFDADPEMATVRILWAVREAVQTALGGCVVVGDYEARLITGYLQEPEPA